MNLDDIPNWVQAVFVVHETLRRCGFPTDDISGCLTKSGQVVVILKSQGKEEFNICVQMLHPGDVTPAALKLLRDGLEAMNHAPEEYLRKAWMTFYAHQPTNYRANLVMALVAAGFYVRPSEQRAPYRPAQA